MDHSKVNQQHHHNSSNSHYGSTAHQLTSPTIHNSHHLNFNNSNFNSHNYHHQSDVNPLTSSVNSIFGSSVLPKQNEGIFDLESGIGNWCTNCSKMNDRHLPEQGNFIRSKSLDDLSSLILQEDHHHNHLNHNHLQNHLNSLIRQDHHPHPHPHHPHPHPHPHNAPNANGIFNQAMLSSANCDIESVLQKISRLEM